MNQLVQPDWLEANLDAPDLRILDCTVIFERTAGVLNLDSGIEIWEEGHIPRSAHVDLVFDLADRNTDLQFMMPPPGQVAEVMESVSVGDGTRVVAYDREKNMWSARLWWVLRSLGFDDVGVLDGGITRWKAEARPISKEPAPPHPPATFTIRPRDGYFADKHDVLAAIEDDDVLIVNSLTEAHHDGHNFDYGRPGHIPTAVNVPSAGLVDEDTHAYVDLDELAERAKAVLGSGSERAITYCGGGISAASGAFVLTMLGVENVAIYDASMNEWGRDDSLPLTTPS